MNKKSAPDTAKVPPMTREMVAQWEAELDEFVIDIQSRLEDVAESIDEKVEQSCSADPAVSEPQAYTEASPENVPSTPPVLASTHDSAGADLSRIGKGAASVQERVSPEPELVRPVHDIAPAVADVGSGNDVSVNEDSGQRDEAADRLQAIKEKLAARLQGEPS